MYIYLILEKFYYRHLLGALNVFLVSFDLHNVMSDSMLAHLIFMVYICRLRLLHRYKPLPIYRYVLGRAIKILFSLSLFVV
jgi:hypothetical protein